MSAAAMKLMSRSMACAIALLSMVPPPAHACDAPGARRAIEARLAELEGYWNGNKPAELVDALYDKDVVILGEQLPKPAVGRDQAKPLVGELIEAFPSAEITLERIASESSDQMGTWVLWTLAGKEAGQAPTKVRSLFIWSKVGEDWLIRADMYSFGGY
ncbi:hypothetical protein [Sinorhizobium fredii]|uniref:hypothetical protein n=1 Tax=Rhizobium fredii TaxID=380 RepID=UPI003516EF64